jgi:hypothetical protein
MMIFGVGIGLGLGRKSEMKRSFEYHNVLQMNCSDILRILGVVVVGGGGGYRYDERFGIYRP